MRPKLEPLNLGSIARGALLELFDKNAPRIAQNILDTSTDATATRELVFKIKFKPDEGRRAVTVTTTAACKFAAVSEHVSRAYIGKDEQGGAYLFDQDPRQDVLFEAPPKDDKLLDFKDLAANAQ